MSAQAVRPPITPKWWHKALLFAKRFFTIASVAGAVYLVIGSWMFGEWWYDWLWKVQFKDPDYTLAGLRDLLDGNFSLVMAALCVLFLAVLFGRIFAIRLFRIVDRFAGFIVFSSWLTIAVTFLLVYHSYHPTGPSIWEEMERTNDLVSNQLRIVTSLPLVQTPIDFDYIDKDRVSALYNQIEPELVEKERTIANNANTQTKLGLSGGGINAEADSGKGRASTSSFSRAEFSPERKCIDVMKYVIEKGTKYYTTSENWMATRASADRILDFQTSEFAEQMKKFFGKPVPKPLTDDEKKQLQERRRKEGEHYLHSELQALHGLIFVDGVFKKTENGRNVVLVEKFSSKPSQVVFRVNVPNWRKADIPDNTRLRVFGDVISPLSTDGYVDIRAIAVY